ncbi:hypothetical protein ECDEC11D_5485 [Escherichia coli DEC11D]|nr:hypothetical protein ECDEC11D_5485 [Escherichia coli DEC11D]
MSIKHYDVVRAASPSDLAEKLTHKLKEGWQPYGGPVAITPYTLMQAVAIEGDPQVGPSSEPDWFYVVVLAGQSNGMAYGEGLPLPDSYDAPDPRIKQLARRSTVTPGGESCTYNDIIPADHCLHDVQDMSTLNHPKADLSKGQYGCVGQGLHIAKKLLPYIPNNAGSCWYHAVVVVRHSPRARRGHSVRTRGPARIRRAGVWVNRYIRT